MAWVPEAESEVQRYSEDYTDVWRSERLVSPECLASLCSEIVADDSGSALKTPRGDYGKKGITNYGKRFVRSAAALLQRTWGRRRLSFLTLTLPEFSESEALTLGQNWGDVVRRFQEWLKRRLKRAALPTEIVGVTEVQPERLKRGSLSVLHLHLVFVGRRATSEAWALNPAEVRKAWLKILSNKVGREVESSACEELRQVKKSAEGYLGKYMSKGSATIEEMREAGAEAMIPRQWWFCTSEMRRWVKSETVRGRKTGSALEVMVNHWQNGAPFLDGCYMSPIVLDLDGRPVVVGWVGRVPLEVRARVLELISTEVD